MRPLLYVRRIVKVVRLGGVSVLCGLIGRIGLMHER